MEFTVGKVALGKVYSEFFGFPLSISFHRGSPYSHIIWRMKTMNVGGRSSETSHSIDVNNNNITVYQAL
jgi:hypothetical protein